MKEALFVHAVQFGYHIDTLYYCKYLKDEYNVTYVCWDYGNERVTEDDVRVVYVPRTGSKFVRLRRLIRVALDEMKAGKHDLAFVVYFRLCALLGILGAAKEIVMDVRTGWIRPGWLRKKAFNLGILLESFAFKNVSVITEELRLKLKLPRSKCHILPLGAEIWEMDFKQFEGMHLLYVGTFQNRHIYKTVRGFDAFAAEVPETFPLTYDIIGSGTPEEIEQMKETIRQAKHNHRIRYHGRIPHKKLPPYFAACNIGVAFVPLIDAQAAQPYTKVYEYLQSGMPVLATANPSNLKVITEDNGVLFQDTPEAFTEAMRRMKAHLALYDSKRIKSAAAEFSWAAIVRSNLKPYFNRLQGREDGQSGGEV
jgi:glycosyltransferase involved in cell wall biosynthesis